MTGLDWIDLESSTVTSAAYDPDAEMIYVRFKDGGAYSYDQCPPHVWEEFTAPGQSPANFSMRFCDTSRTTSSTTSLTRQMGCRSKRQQ
jgi:hypothetical protein